MIVNTMWSSIHHFCNCKTKWIISKSNIITFPSFYLSKGVIFSCKTIIVVLFCIRIYAMFDLSWPIQPILKSESNPRVITNWFFKKWSLMFEIFLRSEWGAYLDFAFESFIIFTIDFVKEFSPHCDTLWLTSNATCYHLTLQIAKCRAINHKPPWIQEIIKFACA